MELLLKMNKLALHQQIYSKMISTILILIRKLSMKLALTSVPVLLNNGGEKKVSGWTISECSETNL